MYSALKDSLEGIIEAVWVQNVIDTEQELERRRRGILVYLHVRPHSYLNWEA